jgi:hypothetical protein
MTRRTDPLDGRQCMEFSGSVGCSGRDESKHDEARRSTTAGDGREGGGRAEGMTSVLLFPPGYLIG